MLLVTYHRLFNGLSPVYYLSLCSSTYIIVSPSIIPIMSIILFRKCFAITGTYHGSYVYAYTEGEARRIFHSMYNGESIISIRRCFYYE